MPDEHQDRDARLDADTIPSHPRFLVFLDFDGVLHRGERRWFERLPLLMTWLEHNPEVCVVVSSSHRESTGRLKLLEALPPALQSRLAGQTPVLARGPLDPPIPHVRQREIEAYLRACDIPLEGFAAVDDDPTLFALDWSHLVRCDGRVGLTTEILLEVSRVLRMNESYSYDSADRRAGRTCTRAS